MLTMVLYALDYQLKPTTLHYSAPTAPHALQLTEVVHASDSMLLWTHLTTMQVFLTLERLEHNAHLTALGTQQLLHTWLFMAV
jgi:hypothetical protein